MAKRSVRCLFCRSRKTVRNGRRKLIVGYTIQRILCRDCHRSFNLRYYPRARITYHYRVALTRAHLEGRTSIRTLSRQTGHSTTTVMKSIHMVTTRCVGAAWIASRFKPQWSGYLALDGKIIRVWDWAAKHIHYTKEERRWLHKMTFLVALDLQTLDIPTHYVGDEETMIDLIMFLKSLRDLGYPLKGYISDGNPDIPRAIERVFGNDIPHQLCIRHFLQNLRSKLREQLISLETYQDACYQILSGKPPRHLSVPTNLFTYQRVPNLPRTNQACENLFRFFSLRLKTIGQFHNWQTATHYCNALVLMRRFIPFTDRKRQPNGHSPLEMAGCNLKGLDYLTMGKINR